MSFVSVVYFFILMYGLGHAATRFLKTKDYWEKHLMRFGIGLGVFPILACLFNLVTIPLNWMVFLVVALVSPAYSLYKERSLPFEEKLTKPPVSVLLVLLFALGLFIAFHQGAFSYPWLENGDPWEYAEAAKYISVQQTFNRELEPVYDRPPQEVLSSGNSTEIYNQIHGSYGSVMDPYPQGYQIVMGVLHQTNNSVSWTLKFFNALIISFGIIFFYYFVKRLTNSNTKGVLAAFVLATTPCYLSHFIFAAPLAVTLFFPALYAVTRIEDDKRWFIPAGLVTASIIVTHHLSTYVFAGFLLLYLVIYSLRDKKFRKYVFLTGLLGVILGLGLFWIPEGIKFGGMLNPLISMKIIGFKGTAFESGVGESYSTMDYIVPPALLGSGDKIDQPIGIGPIGFLFMLLAAASIIVTRPENNKTWKYFVLVLLVFTFLGVHGKSLPFTVIPNAHRLWCYLAIPVSILAAEGMFQVARYIKKYNVQPIQVLTLLAVGLLLTSAYPKYVINTQSIWTPTLRVFGSQGEIQGYAWVKEQPPDTKIFPLCSNYQKILGYDGLVSFWNEDERTYQKKSLNYSIEEIDTWLKARDYEYASIDYSCTFLWDGDTVNKALGNMSNSNKFQLAYMYPKDQPQVFIFKVL